jgi:hypothetical protein
MKKASKNSARLLRATSLLKERLGSRVSLRPDDLFRASFDGSKLSFLPDADPGPAVIEEAFFLLQTPVAIVIPERNDSSTFSRGSQAGIEVSVLADHDMPHRPQIVGRHLGAEPLGQGYSAVVGSAASPDHGSTFSGLLRIPGPGRSRQSNNAEDRQQKGNRRFHDVSLVRKNEGSKTLLSEKYDFAN